MVEIESGIREPEGSHTATRMGSTMKPRAVCKAQGGYVDAQSAGKDVRDLLLVFTRRALFLALVDLLVAPQVRDDGEVTTAALDITCKCCSYS